MEKSHTNRLSKETSPYLLQHQHNPVDWYSWGPEAFEAARTQDKPIFLSVGYSACYWCHVMERQCFENGAIAAEMNRLFINIKVDREERPDVDQLYMTAVQVLTRQGGWPMSVFLLPDLRPFYGGTYFPPTDGHGRPGFPTLLRALEDAYRNRKADVEKTSQQLVEIIGQLATPAAASSPIPKHTPLVDQALIDALIARSVSDYDTQFGGFGRAPKFPRQTLLELILVRLRDQPDAPLEKMIRHTLDALANGGIRDHLGGGFHRYSTDQHWLVPHFEIMLYDNAMLAWVYVEAYRQFKQPRYAHVARSICDFVLREMTAPDGSFYTAFDAEVDAQEGLTYLWTAAEVQAELGAADADLFNRVYGLAGGPNFADPHHGNGTPDKNVLFLAEGPALESDQRIVAMRRKLLAARLRRKQPLLDTKILTSWNALMIRALAFAGDVLKEPRYADAASKAADFLLEHHSDGDGGLLRTSRGGPAKLNGFLDDYAFLAQALLALARSDAGEGRRAQAIDLATRMQQRFGDPHGGGFYFTDNRARDLIVRQKIASDSPLPSGNAIAASVFLEIGRPELAGQLLTVFAAQLRSNGESMSSMIEAAAVYVRENGPAASSTEGKSVEWPQADEVVSLAARWVDPLTITLTVNIRDGFHIGGHDAMPQMVDTRIAVAHEEVEIDYPPGLSVVFPFAEDELLVYLGKVEIGVRFRRAPSMPVRLSIRYQACNDRSCLAVASRTIEVGALP